MKSRIMFGVYLAYLTRKFRSPLIAEVVLFLIFAVILLFFVSVPSVVANMLASGDFYSYLVMAFSHTDILVKSIFILALITALLFVKNATVFTFSFFKERLA
ncbi:MAG: hypothetical protein WBL19_02605 [Minisyncoccia bacterium]